MYKTFFPIYHFEFPNQEEIDNLEISADKPYDPELNYELIKRIGFMYGNCLYGISLSIWGKSRDGKYKLIPDLSFDDIQMLSNNLEAYRQEDREINGSWGGSGPEPDMLDIEINSNAYLFLLDYISGKFDKLLDKWISLETARIINIVATEMIESEVPFQELSIQDICEKAENELKLNTVDENNCIVEARLYKFVKAVWEKYLPTAIFRFKNNTADEKIFGNSKPI